MSLAKTTSRFESLARLSEPTGAQQLSGDVCGNVGAIRMPFSCIKVTFSVLTALQGTTEESVAASEALWDFYGNYLQHLLYPIPSLPSMRSEN